METHHINIKKGLDVPLPGIPERHITDLRSIDLYAVKPADVVGFTPRLAVAEGDTVCAGQPLVTDKRDTRHYLPSPVDGVVHAIVRGEKRKLLEVVVKRNLAPIPSPSKREEQTSNGNHSPLLEGEGSGVRLSPVWWLLRQRPFGTIADPDAKPKAIIVSLRDTNPLAPDIDYTLKGREHDFEAGCQALDALAPLHLVRPAGPHPAGNVGTQIAALCPINKGECVWTVGAQDVATIGHWVLTGHYRPERLVALGGPAAKAPHYYRLTAGACLSRITEAQLLDPNYPQLPTTNHPLSTRIISGSPLSGTTVAPDGFLGMYDHQLCLIPEGDHYEFMGWLMPGLNKFSFSRTFLSGMLHDFLPKNFNFQFSIFNSINTNLHGSVRPFLFTGSFERVFPFDIYPLQLIKACIVGDIELQEQLGIYEVEPEDFALCEFIDPSKTEIQSIIRNALEVLRKEATA